MTIEVQPEGRRASDVAPHDSGAHRAGPRPRVPIAVGELASLWVATALLTGLAQVASVLIRRELLHRFTWTGRDVVWMSPLGDLLVLAVPALLLLALRAVAPRLVTRGIAAGVLGFPAALGLILLIPGIADYAMFLLALGIAVQLGRVTAAHGDRWLPRVRRLAAALTVLALALGLGVRGWRGTAEMRWRAGTTSAPSDAPNVLILLLDTVRASSMSLYGYARATTPEIAAFGRSGVVFDHAISTAPWTLPAHCSFFTGRLPADHSCRWAVALDGRPTTLAEVLRDRGWRTGGFVANHFYTTYETGLARGFTRWEDFQVSLKQVLCSTTLAQTAIVRSFLWPDEKGRLAGLRKLRIKGEPKPENDRKDAAAVNAEFLDWMDSDTSRPFFAFLNYFDAHDPYEPPAPFATRFAAKPQPLDRYDGGIAYIDHEIGRLLRDLARRGVLDNTVVVIVSDHGDHFGEHAIHNHGNSLYLPLVHVPLVIRQPGRTPAGVRVGRAISLRDLPATILDLVGVRGATGIGGASLAAMWSADSAHAVPGPVVSEVEKSPNLWGRTPANRGAMGAITDDSLRYIRIATGEEELYAYRADPGETRNLIGTPEGARTAAAMLARLRALTKGGPK